MKAAKILYKVIGYIAIVSFFTNIMFFDNPPCFRLLLIGIVLIAVSNLLTNKQTNGKRIHKVY